MQIISGIDKLIDGINNALDVTLPWVGLLLLAGYILNYARTRLKKNRDEIKKGREPRQPTNEIISQALILVTIGVVIYLLFWLVPMLIASIFATWLDNTTWIISTLRWMEIAAVAFVLAYTFGHENGEGRWLVSTLGHLAVIFFGWIVERWLGILFISVPFILMYYLLLNELAHIIIPASNPEDKNERRKRFSVLVAFTWGVQFPILVGGEHAWKKPELRIPGDFTQEFPVPGLLWTKSHQVAGITGGNQFKRVAGPGIIFTGKLERPFQIVDLRLQLRTNEIDVVSDDGISFKARVFTAFRIDQEIWNREIYNKLRLVNPVLQGADKPDHTQGSFPFSYARVLAAISTTSSRAMESDSTIFWDQWTLNIIEDTARKVISQKKLDELWKPANDKKYANALDIIAQEIKDKAMITLRSAGILVYAARIVNFSFPTEDGRAHQIMKQQISSWSSEWMRKRIEILTQAQVESDKMQQEARAYAESQLLNSIAEGLQKTQEIHPDLPKYVISMRFLSALQDYIHKRPGEGEENTEAEERINDLQNYLHNWQNMFFRGNEKDKHA